jgi:hypothetical protein
MIGLFPLPLTALYVVGEEGNWLQASPYAKGRWRTLEEVGVREICGRFSQLGSFAVVE